MQFINKKFIFATIFIILLLGNIILVFSLFKNAIAMNQISQTQKDNDNILSFTNLFIEKVLVSEQQVNFETRLQLETMVRGLNNPEIFNQWQRFTGAVDDQTASIEAKKLLNLLVKSLK